MNMTTLKSSLELNLIVYHPKLDLVNFAIKPFLFTNFHLWNILALFETGDIL